MSHTPVTQSQPLPMPRHSGLLERNGRYYLNRRVPRELLSLYHNQKVIRKSLRTSDYLLNSKTKLSFFVSDEHTQRLIEQPPFASDEGVRVAELKELFALKAVLTSQRSKSRDWVDVYLLLRDHGFTIHDYAAAYAKADMITALDAGLARLCSGKPDSADEGYASLLSLPPSLDQMTAYFLQQRDLYEQHLASEALKRAK